MTPFQVHLIEDDRAVASAIEFLLRTVGYQVAVYESGLDFLRETSNVRAGCIVTDVRMPGPSGIELTAQLRSRHIDLPVIVMSGHDDGSFATLASRAGAAEFIAKPFDDDLLLGAIQRLESGSDEQGM